jgi:pyruvate/2-oxoglutarate/acetoin dehydrogenase E1 component
MSSDSAGRERVVANLNRALRALLDRDDHVYLLGEDLHDPYGGAFKVTRGLSTTFPERVISTPISEGAIVGVAAGLALCGNTAIVEIMFADFLTLAFDQLTNFAAKSVSMYGQRLPLSLVVRCPVGGNRGYGPTHSQSPQKHFIGIPDLALFELSPFHDNAVMLDRMIGLRVPCLYFENKTLYGERMYSGGVVDDLFAYRSVGDGVAPVEVFMSGIEGRIDCAVITAGGTALRTLAAARHAFLTRELTCSVAVLPQLYPFDLEPLIGMLRRADRICIADEATAGGTWGEAMSQQIHERLWRYLSGPVRLVNSKPSVIPAAPHLEKSVLVQEADILAAMNGSADV